MTALAEGARRLTGRTRPTLGERLAALGTASDVGRGRLPDDVLDRAEAVVARASRRLALSGDHTVVALAGATGSGKSSMFNVLCGADLVDVGVRRPTTSITTGAAFGTDNAGEVLDWLDVRRRHHLPDGAGRLEGLVLLDLPDHDSTEVAHHLEVDRLVELVDVLVWVTDPQKYADAALHERYLRRLSGHGEVMMCVLNHVDEVAANDRGRVLADVKRRLVDDGLDGVRVLAASARTGEGVAELREHLERQVVAKKAAATRLAADVRAAAESISSLNGDADPGTLRRADRNQLVDAFADAAGVPTVVRAVERSVVRRGGQHTGWPFTAWLGRLRPDPLRRLHLDLGTSGKELTGVGRASVPEPTRVQRARVDTAVRSAAGRVGADLAPPWAESVRQASVSRLDDLNDSLDRALVGTDLGVTRTSVWWRLARLLQLLLAAAVVAGVLWLGGLAVLGYLQFPAPDPPEQYGLPLPTLLLLGGLVGGLALAFVGRAANRLLGRAKARAAGRRLRSAIGEVADELVVRPLDDELRAYAEVRNALHRALT